MLCNPRDLPRGPQAGPVLRGTPDRACWCEGAEFLKSFRARSPWRRLLDGRRVRRELKAASNLHECGLPVPAPLGAARRRDSSGRWHRLARFQRLPGCDLERAMGQSFEPSRAERFATSLGSALARLHALGLRHTDLHPGNLLVCEPKGDVALLDLRQIQRGPGDLDLLRLVAELGERVPRRAALRFARAYDHGAGITPHRKAHTGQLERSRWASLIQRAPAQRERLIENHLDRWLRPSIRVRRVHAALVATDLDEPSTRGILAFLEHPATNSGVSEGLVQGHLAATPLTVHHGRPNHVRRIWLASARAYERESYAGQPHPATRPVALKLRGRRSIAIVRAPGSSDQGA